ncbi:LSM domain-containing protein [Colletotrichum higginsianum]|uniref:Small nuclear ribonucleoprotein G n=1 Tax=Colletotrichum higginsianum (strain IMI 349063) TaxID=759273 RepID=H1VUB4_COLHI|nr:LSM domain-containing protein [Colletotrichum higginsianum]
MAPAQPELKKYLDKRLFVQLNGSRKVIGVLRGYDVFLNIVLDEAVEEKEGGEKVRLGMVVIRGNSVVMLEALERIGGRRPQPPAVNGESLPGGRSSTRMRSRGFYTAL